MVPPLSTLSITGTSSCGFEKENALVPPRLHKEPIFGRAINMHSRGSTEQCFCVLEPSHGCLYKEKSAL